MMRNPLCLDWHCGLLCIIFGFSGVLVFNKEDYLFKSLWSNDQVGSEEQELNLTVTAILFKTGEYAVLGGISCSVLQNSSS